MTLLWFQRLIERTRQRRELLNQKMGKTPEAAPRKRRTPLSEDLTDNVGGETTKQNLEGDSHFVLMFSFLPYYI